VSNHFTLSVGTVSGPDALQELPSTGEDVSKGVSSRGYWHQHRHADSDGKTLTLYQPSLASMNCDLNVKTVIFVRDGSLERYSEFFGSTFRKSTLNL
jgi:hypothetical protein